MIEFTEKTTCAVSGHRVLTKEFDKKILKRELKELVWRGYETFLVGMALGFDTECFHALEEIKTKENVQIIACVPCLNQDLRFNKQQKEEYRRMIKAADGVVLLQENYDDACMKKRNEFMAERAGALYAYCNHQGSGAYQTLKIAQEKGKTVFKYNQMEREK